MLKQLSSAMNIASSSSKHKSIVKPCIKSGTEDLTGNDFNIILTSQIVNTDIFNHPSECGACQYHSIVSENYLKAN